MATHPFTRRISVGVPDGWLMKESLTLIEPMGRANVIVSSEPVHPTMDAEQYAAIQGDSLAREFSGYWLESFEAAAVFGGRRGWVRRFSWQPPDGVAVRQFQAYAVERGVAFTATATTPVTSSARFAALFEEVIASLAIGPRADVDG